MNRRIIAILAALFILSSSTFSYSTNTSKVKVDTSMISQAKLNNFNNIKFMYPFSKKERDFFIREVQSIKPEYLEGIKVIEVYNPEKTLWYQRALYIPYGKVAIIRINDYSGNFKYQLLHELTHNYCYKQQRYLGHKGCFYNNPIQKEFFKERGEYICGTKNQCSN